MKQTFREMTISDYDSVLNLMKNTEGILVRDADSREMIGKYLDRNPGLSFVCDLNSEIAGCIFGGHDGRRGYLNHLIVLEKYRNLGIAKKLVDLSIKKLNKVGIKKTHIFVQNDNPGGLEFWKKIGWFKRDDFSTFSFISGESDNA